MLSITVKLIVVHLITITLTTSEGRKDRVENLHVYEGEDLELICQYEKSTEVPSVVWKFGMNNLKNVGSKFGYKLKKVDKANTGVYSCKYDGGIKFKKYFNVTVLEPPSIPEITKEEQTHFFGFEYEETVKLMCGVRGKPRPSVAWTKWRSGDLWEPVDIKNNHNYILSNGGQHLDVVLTDKTPGWYKCEASNKHGKASKEMELSIKYVGRTECQEPLRLKVDEHDENITLSCKDRCPNVFYRHRWLYPKHQYYYMMDGEPQLVDNLDFENWVLSLDSDLSTLVISNVTIPQDLGTYFCEFKLDEETYRAYWVLKANDSAVQAQVNTKEVIHEYEKLQRVDSIGNLVYTACALICILAFSYAVYVTWFRSRPSDIIIEASHKMVIERLSKESNSSEYSSIYA